MYDNKIFNSNFSTSNPFRNYNVDNTDTSLKEAYAKLEALKNEQINLQKTPDVINDIANEFKSLSRSEQEYILTSADYQEANMKYQTEFNDFLTNKFVGEYLQTTGSKSLEEVLFTIRKLKGTYKDSYSNGLKELTDKNARLEKELDDIRKQLNV